MRLLVIDEELCWPPATGKKIRTFNLLRELARDHDIDLLCHPNEASSDRAALRELSDSGITAHIADSCQRPASGPWFYLDLLGKLASPLPYSVVKHYHASFAAKIDEMTQSNRYDAVVAEWGPYFHYLRDRADLPRVVCMHNVEATIWQRYYEVERNPLKRWYIGRQWRKMERFERELAAQAELLFAVSDEDRARVHAMTPTANVAVVPNGVDLEYFARDASPEDADSLVFVGSMDWRPNDEGVRWFIADVLPLLWKMNPNAKFTVCGRGPSDELRRVAQSAGDRVTVTGPVDDVRPYAQRARVHVVPLRVGGGSRLKILEAWAMGKPVVATTVGAEGLIGVPDEHYIRADRPDELAAAIADLLGDPGRRAALGKSGRQLVEEEYSWGTLGRRMAAELERLVAHPKETERSP